MLALPRGLKLANMLEVFLKTKFASTIFFNLYFISIFIRTDVEFKLLPSEQHSQCNGQHLVSMHRT